LKGRIPQEIIPPVKQTAKGGGIFKNGSKGGKTEGLVVDEEKTGSFCGNFFDTEGIPE
jgi:hypothetical protein